MEYLYALLLTIAAEGIVMFLLTRSRDWVLWSLYCNLVTNPALNLILYALRPLSERGYRMIVVMLEVTVVFAEAALYCGMSRKSFRCSFFRSFAANAASVLLGFLMW